VVLQHRTKANGEFNKHAASPRHSILFILPTEKVSSPPINVSSFLTRS
jgi:hypothetical protein